MNTAAAHSSIHDTVTAPESIYERYYACEDKDPLAYAFSAKATVHAGMISKPVAKEEQLPLFRCISREPRSEKSAAYFNIPFCETRCTYCGFFIRFSDPEESRRYTDALIAEISATSRTEAVNKWPIHAVYLGGGTPTSLQPQDLLRLLLSIKHLLPLANDCEITLEGRISGLSPELIEAAIVGGVNRFSIGVQSFDTDIRQATGRIDDRETVIATLKRLCSHDQAAVVIDLVYGFPGQTMEMWEQDIYTLQELPLDGVDLYQLNLLPHTTLARMVKDGTSKPAATLPEQSAMYARGVELMQELHWQRLSISHWRTGNRERSLYNRLVKSGAPILAYGCGAGGSLHGYRYANSRDYNDYMQTVADGIKPLAMLAYPAPNKALANLVSDGFDLGMLSLQAMAAAPDNASLNDWALPLLQQWQRAGLLKISGNWLQLTRAGEFWQVTMAQALLNLCEEFTAEKTVEA